MRTLLALALLATVAAVAAATEKVSFQLPGPGGRFDGLHDFPSRYLLLVYQGIP